MTIEDSIKQLEFLNLLQEQIRKQVRDSIVPMDSREDNDFLGKLFVVDSGLSFKPQLCCQLKVNGKAFNIKTELDKTRTAGEVSDSLESALKLIKYQLVDALILGLTGDSAREIGEFFRNKGVR